MLNNYTNSVKPIQYSYSDYEQLYIEGGVDTVIGFEFIKGQLQKTCTRVCNRYITICDRTEVRDDLLLTEIVVCLSEYGCSTTPCYTDSSLNSVTGIDLVYSDSPTNTKVAGVTVKLFKGDTVKFPRELIFKLYGISTDGATLLLTQGVIYTSPGFTLTT